MDEVVGAPGLEALAGGFSCYFTTLSKIANDLSSSYSPTKMRKYTSPKRLSRIFSQRDHEISDSVSRLRTSRERHSSSVAKRQFLGYTAVLDENDGIQIYRSFENIALLKTIDLFGPSAVEVFGPTLTRAV